VCIINFPMYQVTFLTFYLFYFYTGPKLILPCKSNGNTSRLQFNVCNQISDRGRRGGLIVGVLPGASGSGSSPGRGHCCVLRQDPLLSPLSIQEYKWVPANCWGNLTSCGGVTCDGLASRPGGVEILLAASCYRNWG